MMYAIMVHLQAVNLSIRTKDRVSVSKCRLMLVQVKREEQKGRKGRARKCCCLDEDS